MDMHSKHADLVEMVSGLMKVVAGIEKARRHGDAATLSLLGVLARSGRAKPSALAEELDVHQSTITRQIQALEAVGRVQVEQDREDRRSCYVSLTEKGVEEVKRLYEVGLSRFALMVEGWSNEDVRSFARLLNKLVDSQQALHEREKLPAKGSWRRKP